jgi:murein DD-endopeptidase MepM/ murein hydrolase activator NlpD
MVTYKKVSRRKMFMKKLKNKYRLVFFNDNTFEEAWHLRLSLLNVLSVVGTISLVMIVIVTLLIAHTPLRELVIPNYPSKALQRTSIRNAILLDSIERKLKIYDRYFDNLNALISGTDTVFADTSSTKTQNYKNLKFTKSEQEQQLQQRVEKEEQFNFTKTAGPKAESDISEVHFFTPVKGIVTDIFNEKGRHYGVDIVGAPNEVVKATLDGTVIMSSWTIETGYVIQIQHVHNLVSMYKHNANLLKKTGAQVKAGEAIAIIGNSGELSTGPHLHFELWHNGKPINPKDYIVFN